MEILDPDARLGQIFRQILRHLLCQRGDKNFVLLLRFLVNLRNEIVDLPCGRPHRDLRIQKAGRTDNLLRPEQLVLRLIRPRRCGDKQHLIDALLKLLKRQRPVVHRGRQAESIIHQRLLPALVAVIHRADLRDRDVRLIHHDHIVAAEEIHETHRRRPRRPAGQRTRIILNSAAEPCLPHHLDIKIRPFRDALCLKKLSLALEIPHPFLQLRLDLVTGPVDLLLRHHIMRGRENIDMPQLRMRPSRHRLDLRDPVHLIPEEFDAQHIIRPLRRIHLQHIPVQPETPPLQIIAPVIMNLRQRVADLLRALLHPRPERDRHLLIIIRRTQTINTRHRRHHNHVPPLRQRRRRRQPHPVDLIIHRRILGNIRVALRHIRLRLIIIIIGDKILHRIVRKKLPKLTVQLGCKRLIVRNHQRRLVHRRDHIRHRERLARPGDPEQRLKLIPCPEPLHKLLNRLRLIPRRLIRRYQFKMIHNFVPDEFSLFGTKIVPNKLNSSGTISARHESIAW